MNKKKLKKMLHAKQQSHKKTVMKREADTGDSYQEAPENPEPTEDVYEQDPDTLTMKSKHFDFSNVKKVPDFPKQPLDYSGQRAIVNAIHDRLDKELAKSVGKAVYYMGAVANDLPLDVFPMDYEYPDSHMMTDRFQDAQSLLENADDMYGKPSKMEQKVIDVAQKADDDDIIDRKNCCVVDGKKAKALADRFMRAVKGHRMTMTDFTELSQDIDTSQTPELAKRYADRQGQIRSIISDNIGRLYRNAKPFKYTDRDGKAQTAKDYTELYDYLLSVSDASDSNGKSASDFIDRHLHTVNSDLNGLPAVGYFPDDGFYTKLGRDMSKMMGESGFDLEDYTSFGDESIYELDNYDENARESPELKKPLMRLKDEARGEIHFLNRNYYSNQVIDSQTHLPVSDDLMQKTIKLVKKDVAKTTFREFDIKETLNSLDDDAY